MRLPPVGTMLHLSHRVPDPSSCPSEHSARLRNCTSDATRPPYPISKKKEAKVRPAPLSLLRPCRHYAWGDVWRCAAARSCTLPPPERVEGAEYAGRQEGRRGQGRVLCLARALRSTHRPHWCSWMFPRQSRRLPPSLDRIRCRACGLAVVCALGGHVGACPAIADVTLVPSLQGDQPPHPPSVASVYDRGWARATASCGAAVVSPSLGLRQAAGRQTRSRQQGGMQRALWNSTRVSMPVAPGASPAYEQAHL